MKTVALGLLLFFFVPVASAVDVAPRISDREIIESLAELKEGQRALRQQISDLQASTQRQIDDLKASTQQQFDDQKRSIQQQIGDLKTSNQQQFDMLQRQFDMLRSTLWLFITIALAILGAMGKILWEHQKQLTLLQVHLKAR